MEKSAYDRYLAEQGGDAYAKYLAEQRKSAPPEQPPMSRMGRIQGAAETLMDASTLGVSGLAGDLATSVLPWEPSFKELRAARKERRASVPLKARIPLEMGGALATPLPGAGLLKLGKSGLSLGGSLIKQAPQTAKLSTRAGRAALDAALQGGVYGAAGNLNELTPEGVGSAVKMGALSAGVGGGLGALLGSGTEIAVRAARRFKNLGRLDKKAFAIADDMEKLDKANYGTAAGEANSTGPIRDVLQYDPIVAPISKDVRWDASYQGKQMSDAEALMASYRRLSGQQRRAQSALDAAKAGVVGYDPKLSEGTIENLARAKANLLNAAETPSTVVVPGRARSVAARQTAQSPAPSVRDALDAFRTRLGKVVTRKEGTVMQQKAREGLDRHITENVVSPSLTGAPAPGRFIERPSKTVPIDAGIPSLRKAIDTHRVKAGELDALTRGADIGLAVGRNKSIPGGKLRTQSREAYLRAIPKMTDAEAEAALAGIMGRFPEQVSLTSSPLGAFGLVTSAVRAPLTMARTMPIIRALEAKLGRGNMGQGAGDLARGTSTRLLSSIFANKDIP